MDRVPYRRVSPSRMGKDAGFSRGEARTRSRALPGTAAAEPYSDEVTSGETVILQCLICGIIMIFVLIASLVDIGPAAAVRNGLRQALSGAETVNELITDVRHFGEELLSREETEPDTLFEYTPPLTTIEVNPVGTVIYDPGLNSQIPGSSAVPELWD